MAALVSTALVASPLAAFTAADGHSRKPVGDAFAQQGKPRLAEASHEVIGALMVARQARMALASGQADQAESLVQKAISDL